MEDCVGVIINGRKLIVNKEGEIWGLNKQTNKLKLINNINNSHGYNCLRCNKKTFLRHRIMAYVYLNLDLNNVNLHIDHIDRNRINNKLSNLRIVTNQQNCWNREAKGYALHKKSNKWMSRIKFNNKQIHLGYFTTEEEAHNAYLEAKKKYHII